MANRNFARNWSMDRGTVILAGRVAIGGSGAVGLKTGGTGVTVTRNSAGSYTLTTDPYVAILYADVQLVKAAAENVYVQASGTTAAATGNTATFVVYTGGGVTPVELDSGDSIMFLIVAKNSSVSP